MSKEVINMLLLLGAVLVYFFLIFRAPMKRRKELKKFVESLSAGDKVITSSVAKVQHPPESATTGRGRRSQPGSQQAPLWQVLWVCWRTQ